MKTICVDLDGVINQYVGWGHGELDTPSIDGAFTALLKLEKEYKIVIFTTRAGADNDITNYTNEAGETFHGIEAIRQWIDHHCILETGTTPTYNWEITNQKVPAIAYIDDRAIRFTNWQDVKKYFQ